MSHVYLFIDFILHINIYLDAIISYAGWWIYLILFLILFAETGLVVTPFLPGDSLLFAVGILSATKLNIFVALPVLILAVTIGDNCNYFIGRFIGKKLIDRNSRILNKKHIEKSHLFFEKYGSRAIFIARFIPIVRTFMPFSAGIGEMCYKKFAMLSFLAACFWIILITCSGYFFGNIKLVKDNFSIVVIAIIVVSILPIIIKLIKNKKTNH